MGAHLGLTPARYQSGETDTAKSAAAETCSPRPCSGGRLHSAGSQREVVGPCGPGAHEGCEGARPRSPGGGQPRSVVRSALSQDQVKQRRQVSARRRAPFRPISAAMRLRGSSETSDRSRHAMSIVLSPLASREASWDEGQREERGPKPCRSAARGSTQIMFALTKTVPRFETRPS